MYALTLHQPWAWAVAAGYKRVENRRWPPPASVIGEQIAIHAGQHFDAAALDFVAALTPSLPDRYDHGAIIALARVLDVVTDSDDPWFFGPYGWLFGDVVRIRPVPCRGWQRLWRLPQEISTSLQHPGPADTVQCTR